MFFGPWDRFFWFCWPWKVFVGMRASGFSISAPRSIVNISSWMGCMTGTFHGKGSCTFVQLGFGLLAVGKCWDTHIQFLKSLTHIFNFWSLWQCVSSVHNIQGHETVHSTPIAGPMHPLVREHWRHRDWWGAPSNLLDSFLSWLAWRMS